MPFVKTVPFEKADEQTKAAYEGLLQTRGRIANVIGVSSLRPHLMTTLSAHIRSVMTTESGLTPAERQMVATVVSATNKCQY
ncbi:MAG: carboxymuconolactone decarboxylase family protein [Chloroflexi bacterium]|jgi:alkylhydroperoxidase family enzyme|nr:carboxymuconolactone decarboxylase family protein [Chloroflexota bacterium]MCH8226284.1 carboxymuconolactone decarboxylase family protein [Chloroflexota bacterium]